MKIDSNVANLRALVRANSIIADIHARHLVARSGVTGFAALIAGFGLVMLGLAAFFALEQAWGPIWAAVAIGLASCAIALVLAFVAGHIRPGRDLELAREVHRSAMEGLLADGRSIEAELADLKNAFRHPLDSLIPGVIIPLASILLKSMKKSGKSPSAGE
jgi:hypothetical protein